MFVIQWRWLIISFCVPFSKHSPQESEFQETASDRSDYRDTEDGGLSGMEKNTSFLLFTTDSHLHLQIIPAGFVGHRFENVCVCVWWGILLALSSADGKKMWRNGILMKRIATACEEMIWFTQLWRQCVNVLLWKNFCSIRYQLRNDRRDFSLSICSKYW